MSEAGPKVLPPPDGPTLTHLLRQNLALLAELVQRYEVARRPEPGGRLVVRRPADVAAYLGPEMADLAQEQLRVLALNVKNHLIGATLVYQGGANSVVVRLADFFREAVRLGASAIVLLHNHPSGDPTPSEEDIRVTREVAQVGDLLGIEVLDHLIIGAKDFVSLRQREFYRPISCPPARGGRKTAAGCCRPTWEIDDA